MEYDICPAAEPIIVPVEDNQSFSDLSRRNFLRAAGLLVAGMAARHAGATGRSASIVGSGHRVVLVVIGGVRREETFSDEGQVNIPQLSADLLPRSLFYRHARNEGVTAHFNAISSILTGNWQHVDDWGKLAPTTPTIFEQYRKDLGGARSNTWVVASNKALTNLIGASSDKSFGPSYGANVVFPKQLMLAAVEEALRDGRTANMADRSKVEAELENVIAGSNYEGLGWNVFDAADQLDPRTRETIQTAIANFVRSGGPTSGDELTFYMTREVMRKYSPQVIMVAFSDVEAAHFGSYAMHVAGIRTVDRLIGELWAEIESNPDYRGQTTLVVMPEFGRDPDGSPTNGFFNHRFSGDSTRDTWMLAVGAAIDRPQIVERPIRHVDICPTFASLLGCPLSDAQGAKIAEFRV